MLQFFPKKRDIYLHIVVLGVGLIAPDLQNQLLLGKHHVPAPHQQLHQVKFLAAEPDGTFSAGKLKGIRFQMQVAVLQIVGRPLLRLAAGQHPNAGQQLLRLKGLGQIVIRAAVQPLHPVRKLRTGREHQHRDSFSSLPQLPQDGKSVLLRQHHI